MAFKLDSKIPAGELAQKWSNHKAAIKVVSPANKRKLDIIVIGTGLGGASAAASLGELGYNVKGLLHPGFAPPRPLDRRAGRYQRREELPERQRLGIPSLLRYDQGRRLPRPRGQRLSSGRGFEPHHRPVRGPGSALRTRVRRPAGQPFVRRRAGIAYLLCPRPDGSAAPFGCLRRTEQGDRGRFGEELSAPRDARHRHRGRRRRAASSPATS